MNVQNPYQSMTKRQLTLEAKKRNLKLSGQENLVDLLLEHDRASGHLNASSTSSRTANSNKSVTGLNGHSSNGRSNSNSSNNSKSRSANSKTPNSKTSSKSNMHLDPDSPLYNANGEDCISCGVNPLAREVERENRAQIVLHKRPFQTLYYFVRELPFVAMTLISRMLRYRVTVTVVVLLCVLGFCLDFVEGPHSQVWGNGKKKVLWWGWWVVLGFMSSCGFGTGLHTFVLYLGPFIAKVTLAAYECRTTKFPSPPYPDEVICPSAPYPQVEISLWSVIKKVQVEAVLWGIGTAIGELPPYFVARAARLSGQCEDEEVEEFEELLRSKEEFLQETGKAPASKLPITRSSQPPTRKRKRTDSGTDYRSLPWTKRAELWVTDLILRAGFIGIVACASIPNPLFDLAGMTCGHFLVPFWSFFGATLIGKAFIKMHIQQLFVITMFTEHHVEAILAAMRYIPVYGERLRQPFLDYLALQKEKLHNAVVSHDSSWLQTLTGVITWALIGFFVYSIVNSLAQSYDRRLCKWRRAAAEFNEKVQ